MGAGAGLYGGMNTSAQSSGVPAQGGKGGVQQPQVQQPAQVPAQGGKTPNANGTYTGQLSPQMSPYIDAMQPQPGQPLTPGPNTAPPGQQIIGFRSPGRGQTLSDYNIYGPINPPSNTGLVPAQGGKGNMPLPSHYQSPYANYGFDPGLQSYLDQQNYRSSKDMGVAFQYDPTNQTFTGGTMAGRYNPIPLNVMQQVAGGNRDVLNPYFQSKFPQPTGPMPQPTRVAGPPPLPLSAYIRNERSPVAQRNFELARQAQSSGPPTATEMAVRAKLERGREAALQERLQNATTQELQALGLPRPQVLPAQPQQQGLMGLQNSGFSRFKNRYR